MYTCLCLSKNRVRNRQGKQSSSSPNMAGEEGSFGHGPKNGECSRSDRKSLEQGEGRASGAWVVWGRPCYLLMPLLETGVDVGSLSRPKEIPAFLALPSRDKQEPRPYTQMLLSILSPATPSVEKHSQYPFPFTDGETEAQDTETKTALNMAHPTAACVAEPSSRTAASRKLPLPPSILVS